LTEHPPHPPALIDYPAIVMLPVLWRDMDAFRHVNNATYLTWFEMARIEFLMRGGLADWMSGEGLSPLLASITCRYRRQLRHPDRIWVGTRLGEVGRTRFSMEHAVYSENEQAIAADGESVIVLFDQRRQRPARIPTELLAKGL
jgi:acyl-CoA thioester hydrolase